jgi:hypothetical protein
MIDWGLGGSTPTSPQMMDWGRGEVPLHPQEDRLGSGGKYPNIPSMIDWGLGEVPLHPPR